MTARDTEDALHREADLAIAKRDYAEALAILRQLVAISPNNAANWLKLASVQRAAGDIRAALDSVEHPLRFAPRQFVALLMRAQLLSLAGKLDEAGEAFGRALANAPPEGVPAFLSQIYERAEGEYRAWQIRHAEMLREAVRNVGSLTAAVERMITNAVRLTEPDRDGPSHYCYPGLPEKGFHEARCFPWLNELQAASAQISAELGALLQSRSMQKAAYIRYPEGVPVDQWAALNHNPDWSALHLIERGHIVEANARHCPTTMDVLRRMPQPVMAGAGPNAMFSLLAPKTHIPPHRGVSNTRLLCHLPLIVPPGCWFRVGEETRYWEAGKAWVFDDTLDHEALNPSDDLRIILIADIWNPSIPESDRSAVATVISAGAKHIHGL